MHLAELDRRHGRAYFAVQAIAGAAWWVAVLRWPEVSAATLGSLPRVATAAVDLPSFVVGSALVAAGLRPAVWVVAPVAVLLSAVTVVAATVTGRGGLGALLMVMASVATVGAASLVLHGRLATELILVGPFRFRSASSSASQLRRTVGQLVVVWGLFLGVLPPLVALIEHRWGMRLTLPGFLGLLGVILFVAASSFGVWSAVVMARDGHGTPLPRTMANELVLAGPYQWVRNPMAIAGVVQAVAVGMMLGSWLVVLYALAGAALWNFVIRPLEEADLEARFGTAYRTYRGRVPCWLPRLQLSCRGR